MSENVTHQESLTRTQVEDAIRSVRDRGWDVNPYTVAEEAKASHAEISKSPEFMQLIVMARGGDVSFQPSQQSRVNELEAEVRALQSKLNSSVLAGTPSEDDLLNEQMKALLSSESDEQVKHLEKELENAYAQVVTLEEDKVDLTRSVTGLEKINEALNYRMRELEGESSELKRQLASQTAERPEKSYEDMEKINREMALRLEELISNHRANNEHIALLEATNSQHESVILELEAKLAELQQEADMLALQLQNAFQIGYQKGVADNKPGATPEEQAAQAAQMAQEISQELTGEFGAAIASHLDTGDQQVYASNQYHEMHQQMPNDEIRHQQQPPQVAAQASEQDVHGGWGPEAEHVLNFAKTGPYVASNFNPLESLSWRDLETVYSMGVLSIKDFSRSLTDYATATDAQFQAVAEQAPQRPDPEPRVAHQPVEQAGSTATFSNDASPRSSAVPFPDDTIQPNAGLRAVQPFPENTVEMQAFTELEAAVPPNQYSEVQNMFTEQAYQGDPTLDAYGHAVGETTQAETRLFPENENEPPLAEPPKSDGALDFIDELIDLDKLDIFDSLEDLAELGKIDVLSEPIMPFDMGDEATVETPAVEQTGTPSDEELRNLLNNRTAAASQDPTGEQTVKTPPVESGSGMSIEDEIRQRQIPGASRKFVGGKAAQSAPPPADAPAASPVTASSTGTPSIKHIPPEIRKACMILGVRPEDMTKELVNKEWKRQIAACHPDLGGDTETSIYLNTAKDTLIRWLDQNTPKLGGKFGQKGSSSPFTGKTKSDEKS